MSGLIVQQLVKSFGDKLLLDHVSFHVQAGEHIGLLGTNGTGKSTLLNIIAGREPADSGELIHANDFHIGYLAQDTAFDMSATVFDAVYAGEAPMLSLVRAYEQSVINLMQADNATNQREFMRLEAEMSAADAWHVETRIKTILTKLGITQLDAALSSLSGGQLKRVALAQVLIQEPDLLILDEPTNHLDVDSIMWLEKYLQQYRGALLLVTHDRYFLERVVSKIVELRHGQVAIYEGNYEKYLEERALRDTQAAAIAHKKQRLYEAELAWMRRGAKARTTKQQARIQRFDALKEDLQNVTSQASLQLSDFSHERLGKRVLVCEDCTLTRDDKTIVRRLNLLVQARDRIGVVGENGIGKSSLLSALAGELSFDSGVYTVGDTVKLVYYKQLSEDIPEDKRVIQYMQSVAEEAQLASGERIGVSELLEKFLFPPAMHGVLIGKLSGGEKRRLYLLSLLMQQPNILLLDEPTNDLDIETLRVLEQYFEEFPGAIIVVSHDRYFLDRVAERLLILEPQQTVSQYIGALSDYLQQRSDSVAVPEEKEKAAKVRVSKPRRSYQEQREWETIEDEIAELEAQREAIQEEMYSVSDDFVRLQTLQESLEQCDETLLERMARWEYLSQFEE